jgi:hypothetical protein
MKIIFVCLIFWVLSSSCRLMHRDKDGAIIKVNAICFDKNLTFGVAEITKSHSLSIAFSESVQFDAPNAGYSRYKITSGFALLLCEAGLEYNLYAYDILNRKMSKYIVPRFAEYIDFAFSSNGNKLAVYSPFANEGEFIFLMEVVDGENKFALKRKVGVKYASLDGMFFDANNKLNILAFDEAFSLFELMIKPEWLYVNLILIRIDGRMYIFSVNL